MGNSLEVQWLRLRASTARDTGSSLVRELRSHMPHSTATKNNNKIKWTVVMFAQLWEYTKNHWILYFKWVNFMACNLYLNKAVILKKMNRSSVTCETTSNIFQKTSFKMKANIKWITNKHLLYSTGNYTQYLTITYNGKESKIIYLYIYILLYIYMTESLCWTPET